MKPLTSSLMERTILILKPFLPAKSTIIEKDLYLMKFTDNDELSDVELSFRLTNSNINFAIYIIKNVHGRLRTGIFISGLFIDTLLDQTSIKRIIIPYIKCEYINNVLDLICSTDLANINLAYETRHTYLK